MSNFGHSTSIVGFTPEEIYDNRHFGILVLKRLFLKCPIGADIPIQNLYSANQVAASSNSPHVIMSRRNGYLFPALYSKIHFLYDKAKSSIKFAVID